MEVDSLTLGTAGYAPKIPEPPSVQPNGIGEAGHTLNVPAKEMIVMGTESDKALEKNTEGKPQKAMNISEEDIQKSIDTANKKIQPLYLEFQYKIHTKTNQLMVSVINTSTKEVVREIPPEKALDALAKMWELAGILVDKKG